MHIGWLSHTNSKIKKLQSHPGCWLDCKVPIGFCPPARYAAQPVRNDIRDLVEPKTKKVTPEQSILALSLALVLFRLHESNAGWEEWLSVDIPSSATEISKLLIEVDTFTQGNNRLEPAIVQNILGKEQVEARIQELSKRAAAWLEQAPQKGTRFPGADDVWKRIVGSKGTLHTWFDLVAQDDRKSAEKVRTELEKWEVSRLVRRLYSKVKP